MNKNKAISISNQSSIEISKLLDEDGEIEFTVNYLGSCITYWLNLNEVESIRNHLTKIIEDNKVNN